MENGAWIVITVGVLILLLFRDPILGLILPRRLTGTAYLVKQLRGRGIDPHPIGLAALHDIVDSSKKLSRYQAMTKEKTKGEWFIENLEVAANEIADIQAGRRVSSPDHWIDKILIRHGVIGPH